ncbi:MAG: radical SAM protein, partial [Candidatus Saliniplasma sp.]
IVLVHGGVTVPGKYLSGEPLSVEEAVEIADQPGETYLGGPLARYSEVSGYDHLVEKDLAAYFYDSLFGEGVDRWAEVEEREDWLKFGAKAVKRHLMFPDPLLAEIETFRGCPRYISGGCSFCSEPVYGEPQFREQEDIVEEMGLLYDYGIRHFRLGGQSCIFSYKAEGVGEVEVVEPRPVELEELFSGIVDRCPDLKVLHVDNANPAVISEYPDKSEEIMKILVDYCTSGNVIALGLESADGIVIEKNNLNTDTRETKEAVRITNKVGADAGDNGMPELLPGINFLGGLIGESEETYEKNLEFLKELLEEELLLRRINIRQVMGTGEWKVDKRNFQYFKKRVREEIDRPMLKRMLPEGRVLRDVYMEKHDDGITFGRQIGTYPLLVGVRYELELGRYYDIKLTEYGYRSVTGIHQPFYLDEASFKELQEVPGIGKKRAAKIFREQPKSEGELEELLEDRRSFEKIMEYIEFK